MNVDTLISLAKSGDFNALSDLLRAIERDVYRFIYSQIEQTEDAKDLTQETLLRVCRSIHTFDGRSKFSTWVIRIAINLIIDWKKKKKDTLAPNGELPQAVNTNSPEQLVLRHQEKEQLIHILDQLPDQTRAILLLRYIHDFSYQMISDTLGIPIGTVGSLIQRSRKFIQSQWTKHG